MLGGKCAFFPNNTTPDGTITKALQGLMTLANELAPNASINDAFTVWLEEWFGKWKGLMASVLIFLIIIARFLMLMGYCIISHVTGLARRLIEVAINKQMPMTYQQNNLLLLGTKLDTLSYDEESQQILEQLVKQKTHC
jgi:hypothetical protein